MIPAGGRGNAARYPFTAVDMVFLDPLRNPSDDPGTAPRSAEDGLPA